MKFHQLAMDSLFHYQGERLRKTSPLVAVYIDSGKPKFMARAAEVEPLREEGEPATDLTSDAPSNAATTDTRQVIQAFDDFYQTCLDNLDGLQGQLDEPLLNSLRKDLEKARQRFLRNL